MDRGGSNFDDIKDNAYYAWPVRMDRRGGGFDDTEDNTDDKWPVRGGHERR